MSNERIFFSYATENRGVVDQYLDAFRQRGIEVWIDHEQIRYGDSLVARIEEAIQQCRHAVIFFSKEYAEKVWTSEEKKALVHMLIESSRTGDETRTVFVVR